MKYLMKCGHASNAKTADGKPCCVICGCAEVVREAKGTEGLEGRKSKCPECGRIEDSHWGLPFFEYRPDEEFDQHYDGCRGWE